MTQEGLQLIISHEGFRPNAYWDRHGKKWTIGYGTTVYPNGRPVRRGETITREQAARVLNDTISKTIVPQINSMVTARLNQWQMDALTSFAYNCGVGNLRKSTLLQKVNADPNDLSIRNEFAKWRNAGGESMPGLAARRSAEADLYFRGYRPPKDSPIVQRLSKDFRERYANNPEALAKARDKVEAENRIRAELSNQAKEYSREYMRRYAERMQAERDARAELSRQARARSSEYLRRYLQSRKQGVNENLVRKAVAEVVSERLRDILG